MKLRTDSARSFGATSSPRALDLSGGGMFAPAQQAREERRALDLAGAQAAARTRPALDLEDPGYLQQRAKSAASQSQQLRDLEQRQKSLTATSGPSPMTPPAQWAANLRAMQRSGYNQDVEDALGRYQRALDLGGGFSPQQARPAARRALDLSGGDPGVGGGYPLDLAGASYGQNPGLSKAIDRQMRTWDDREQSARSGAEAEARSTFSTYRGLVGRGYAPEGALGFLDTGDPADLGQRAITTKPADPLILRSRFNRAYPEKKLTDFLADAKKGGEYTRKNAESGEDEFDQGAAQSAYKRYQADRQRQLEDYLASQGGATQQLNLSTPDSPVAGGKVTGADAARLHPMAIPSVAGSAPLALAAPVALPLSLAGAGLAGLASLAGVAGGQPSRTSEPGGTPYVPLSGTRPIAPLIQGGQAAYPAPRQETFQAALNLAPEDVGLRSGQAPAPSPLDLAPDVYRFQGAPPLPMGYDRAGNPLPGAISLMPWGGGGDGPATSQRAIDIEKLQSARQSIANERGAIDHARTFGALPKLPEAPYEAPYREHPALEDQTARWLRANKVDPGEVIRRFPDPDKQARYLTFLRKKLTGIGV